MKTKTSKAKNLTGKGLHITIILSRFNDSLGNMLLKNTQEYLLANSVEEKKIKIIRVPGALEIPLVAELVARSKKTDVIIALGIVIKGETPHFEQVSRESHSGLMQVSLANKIPVIFGILTTNTLEQAKDRINKKKLNKAKEFAETAVEMAGLMKSLRKK